MKKKINWDSKTKHPKKLNMVGLLDQKKISFHSFLFQLFNMINLCSDKLNIILKKWCMWREINTKTWRKEEKWNKKIGFFQWSLILYYSLTVEWVQTNSSLLPCNGVLYQKDKGFGKGHGLLNKIKMIHSWRIMQIIIPKTPTKGGNKTSPVERQQTFPARFSAGKVRIMREAVELGLPEKY